MPEKSESQKDSNVKLKCSLSGKVSFGEGFKNEYRMRDRHDNNYEQKIKAHSELENLSSLSSL